MAPGQVRVNIFGSDYTLQSDEDENYIKDIAKYVDNKMREIDRQFSLKSSVKVAILAAMQIVDELFQERKHKEKILTYVNDESKELDRLILSKMSE